MKHRLAALAAGLALALGGCGDAREAAGPLPTAPGEARFNAYDSSNGGEYICAISVTPTSQAVTVGSKAYFSVRRDICSRSTGQFLYTDTRGTYWGSSNTSIATVGSATNSATMNVTVSTHSPGTVTITANALCCTIDYQGATASGTLTVNPPPFSVSMSGPDTVQSNYGGYCSWYANVTSGVAPFTYAWYKNGTLVGTSSSYYANYIYYSHYLEVRVTDATGTTKTFGKTISVTSSYWYHC